MFISARNEGFPSCNYTYFLGSEFERYTPSVVTPKFIFYNFSPPFSFCRHVKWLQIPHWYCAYVNIVGALNKEISLSVYWLHFLFFIPVVLLRLDLPSIVHKSGCSPHWLHCFSGSSHLAVHVSGFVLVSHSAGVSVRWLLRFEAGGRLLPLLFTAESPRSFLHDPRQAVFCCSQEVAQFRLPPSLSRPPDIWFT